MGVEWRHNEIVWQIFKQFAVDGWYVIRHRKLLSFRRVSSKKLKVANDGPTWMFMLVSNFLADIRGICKSRKYGYNSTMCTVS